jgi:hypothetical protein
VEQPTVLERKRIRNSMKKIRRVLRKIFNWLGSGWSEASEIQRRINEEKDRYHRDYWGMR